MITIQEALYHCKLKMRDDEDPPITTMFEWFDKQNFSSEEIDSGRKGLLIAVLKHYFDKNHEWLLKCFEICNQSTNNLFKLKFYGLELSVDVDSISISVSVSKNTSKHSQTFIYKNYHLNQLDIMFKDLDTFIETTSISIVDTLLN